MVGRLIRLRRVALLVAGRGALVFGARSALLVAGRAALVFAGRSALVFAGRVAIVVVLLGAVGCYRVNTPRAQRTVVPPDAVLPSDAVLPPDAVPRPEYKSRLGNPAFYDEFGVRYRVLETSKDFVERGIASWYGHPFHGRATSTGETYDMYAMTAAHKTLPLPTYVRVTDLDTGNRVVVRVNDRGPFVEGRVIDLSYVAALKLGIVREGTARVEVRALDPPALDPPALDPPGMDGPGMDPPALDRSGMDPPALDRSGMDPPGKARSRKARSARSRVPPA